MDVHCNCKKIDNYANKRAIFCDNLESYLLHTVFHLEIWTPSF